MYMCYDEKMKTRERTRNRRMTHEGEFNARITPHLWFDREAREAAEFYTSVFSTREKSPSGGKNSVVKNVSTIHNTPSGSVDMVTIELYGQGFSLISAGPYFKFTPAVSFLVACATREEVDALWTPLSNAGTPLMDLGEYPFSEHYGWIQDRYGRFVASNAHGRTASTAENHPDAYVCGRAMRKKQKKQSTSTQRCFTMHAPATSSPTAKAKNQTRKGR